MEAVSNIREYQNIAKEMLQLETTRKMLLFLLCLLSAGFRMLMGCLLMHRYVSSITDLKCHWMSNISLGEHELTMDRMESV